MLTSLFSTKISGGETRLAWLTRKPKGKEDFLPSRLLKTLGETILQKTYPLPFSVPIRGSSMK